MLPQKPTPRGRKLKLRWLVTLSGLPFLGVVTAFGVMPQAGAFIPQTKTVVEEITLPHLAPSGNATTFWHNEHVQRGDTVTDLLRRLNVEDSAADNYLSTARAAESLRKLAVGKLVQVETDAEGGLLALRYPDNSGSQVLIEKSGNNFTNRTLPAQLEQRLFMRAGEIKTTLFAAADEANLPEPATNQLADIFGSDIDFYHDLRPGDRFSVIYEVAYSNGEPVRSGRVLAAEFIRRGKSYRALYFQDGEHGDYYAPDGRNLHKTFLRSPVEFSRISSGFTNSRFHPILHKWGAHRGIDFAAPMGTKVHVTSEGVVSFVGKQNGYGNVIIVKHPGRYSTVYGHLSRFARGLSAGQHVSQNEVIGYVGMTGLATGPHLHYEFRVNNQQRNPMRIALPDTRPLESDRLAAFQSATSAFVARLNLLRNTNLAKLD